MAAFRQPVMKEIMNVVSHMLYIHSIADALSSGCTFPPDIFVQNNGPYEILISLNYENIDMKQRGIDALQHLQEGGAR